jgi:hypothetical protein
MKKLLLFFTILVLAINVNSQTIGLQKTIELTDETTGNFITIDTYDAPAILGDSTLFKVNFKLYKTKASYQSGKVKMNWRHETQFYKKNTDVPIANFIDFLYNQSLLNDSLLKDAVKIYE